MNDGYPFDPTRNTPLGVTDKDVDGEEEAGYEFTPDYFQEPEHHDT